MKKILRISTQAFVVALVLIQFWRPQKNMSPTPGPQDIALRYRVPTNVQSLLQRACYDCHSNHTNYPWYAAVQPVRWWLDSHISEGKEHLNFSAFGSYTTKRVVKKLEEIADEVDQHTMPLKSYTWVHPEARLTPEEIRLITDWADALREVHDP